MLTQLIRHLSWTMILSGPILSVYANPKYLSSVHSTQHSYRNHSGARFETTGTMAADGAELVLLDFHLARSLGLNTEDLQALKTQIESTFGRIVDPTTNGAADDITFATQYSHYHDVTNAGDGRAIWYGEHQIALPSGRVLYLDTVAKGVDKTPFAYFGWSSRTHGFQTLREAVHSFIVSKRNALQGIDTTRDLAVIRLPFKKPFDQNLRSVAITVRVGRQIRPAHYISLGARSAPEHRKFLDWDIRRNLGLPLGQSMTTEIYRQFFYLFITHFAKQSARQSDLNFYHGMLHASNSTSMGGSLDYGTSRQFLHSTTIYSAHHYANLQFKKMFYISLYALGMVPSSQGPNGTPPVIAETLQSSSTSNKVLADVHQSMLTDPTMGPALREFSWIKIQEHYNSAYEEELTRLSLRRLGLNDSQIERLDAFLPQNLMYTIRQVQTKNELADSSSDPDLTHLNWVLAHAFELLLKNSTLDFNQDQMKAEIPTKWKGKIDFSESRNKKLMEAIFKIYRLFNTDTRRQIAERAPKLLAQKAVDHLSMERSPLDILGSSNESKLLAMTESTRSNFLENTRLANQIILETAHTHATGSQQSFTTIDVGFETQAMPSATGKNSCGEPFGDQSSKRSRVSAEG